MKSDMFSPIALCARGPSTSPSSSKSVHNVAPMNRTPSMVVDPGSEQRDSEVPALSIERLARGVDVLSVVIVDSLGTKRMWLGAADHSFGRGRTRPPSRSAPESPAHIGDVDAFDERQGY